MAREGREGDMDELTFFLDVLNFFMTSLDNLRYITVFEKGEDGGEGDKGEDGGEGGE